MAIKFVMIILINLESIHERVVRPTANVFEITESIPASVTNHNARVDIFLIVRPAPAL